MNFNELPAEVIGCLFVLKAKARTDVRTRITVAVIRIREIEAGTGRPNEDRAPFLLLLVAKVCFPISL